MIADVRQASQNAYQKVDSFVDFVNEIGSFATGGTGAEQVLSTLHPELESFRLAVEQCNGGIDEASKDRVVELMRKAEQCRKARLRLIERLRDLHQVV